MATTSKWFLFSVATLLATCAGPIAASAKSTDGYRAMQTSMLVEGVNDQGWIVGRWVDASGTPHWFLMNPFLPAVSEALPHATKAKVLALHMNRF